jgi:hypothetical protein
MAAVSFSAAKFVALIAVRSDGDLLPSPSSTADRHKGLGSLPADSFDVFDSR